MDNTDDLSRRAFFQTLGGGAMLGAAATSKPRHASPKSKALNTKVNAAGFTPAPTLNDPNILVIMVDQLRIPMWLSSAQQTIVNGLLPNIIGRIQNKAFNFQQYFIAASCCTPARSVMISGLYTAQTGMYVGENASNGPALNTAFPTFATAMAALNPVYRGNVWWFGKWHISYPSQASTLLPYGFNTRTYPGGAVGNPSPNGWPNEGVNGGLVNSGPYARQVWCSDAQITGDFIAWLQGQKNTSAPWCSTVSLINPHDIAYAPGWLPPNPFPPVSIPLQPIYFAPPAGTAPLIYNGAPAVWNNENLQQAGLNKPTLQSVFQSGLNSAFGTVTDWVTFLNQYYWLQSIVDQQIGLVLNALYSSPFANNTIVIFASDHGEYAGSHGLHDKGGAVYDEGIRIPLSIMFPGQTSAVSMNQMCSAVDFFGLMCDLVTGGSGQWRLAYPDLANRQSLWSFLSSNSSETRVAPGPIGLPYILTSFDELKSNENAGNLNYSKSHVLCMRTKNDPTSGVAGAKLAFYSAWASCTDVQDPTVTPDPEFYDYNPQSLNNVSEIGNDYFSNNATTQATLQHYQQALGNIGPNPTGLYATEFSAPLVGKGNDGNPLSQTSKTAIQTYVNYISNTGPCPAV